MFSTIVFVFFVFVAFAVFFACTFSFLFMIVVENEVESSLVATMFLLLSVSSTFLGWAFFHALSEVLMKVFG